LCAHEYKCTAHDLMENNTTLLPQSKINLLHESQVT